MLEGALAFRLDGTDVLVPAGGGIVVPAGTEHTFWNPSPKRARYLLVMTAIIARLVEALHDPARREPVDELFRAHDSTLVGWPE